MNDIEIKTLKMLDVIRRFPNISYENQRYITISELETGKINKYLLSSKQWKILYASNVKHNMKGVYLYNEYGTKICNYDISELYTNEHITIPEIKNYYTIEEMTWYTECENKLHVKLLNILNTNLENVIIELEEIPLLRKIMKGLSYYVKQNERIKQNAKQYNNARSSDRKLFGSESSMDLNELSRGIDASRGFNQVRTNGKGGVRGEENGIHVGKQQSTVLPINSSRSLDLVSEGDRQSILEKIPNSVGSSQEILELQGIQQQPKPTSDSLETSRLDGTTSSRERINLYERYSDRIDSFINKYGLSSDEKDSLIKLFVNYNKEIDELDLTGELSLFIMKGINYRNNSSDLDIIKLNWLDYNKSFKENMKKLFDGLLDSELELTFEEKEMEEQSKLDEIYDLEYRTTIVSEQIIDSNYFDNLDNEVLEVNEDAVFDEMAIVDKEVLVEQGSDSLVESTLLEDEIKTNKDNTIKCMIEWSELDEVKEDSFVTIETINNLKLIDDKIYNIKIDDELKDIPYEQRTYGGYYKTKINIYENGVIYDSTRLDLGDGIKSNSDIYEYLYSLINNQKIIEETLSDNKNEEIRYSKKEIAKINIDAIQEVINFENNLGASRNSELIKKYQGFGSIPEIFDASKLEFQQEYSLLKKTINEVDYRKLKSSTLSAFYTPNKIIDSIYKGIKTLGFTNGRILEPSVGTGKFIERMNSDMFRMSQIHAVELDNISSRITKCLYPNIEVRNIGFEQTKYNKGAFDIVIGNVPFGNYKLSETEYNKHNLLIHDHFIIKSLDLAKQGGIVALITTRGTLDKKDFKARVEMAKRGNLIGAIRLPNDVFNHTKVTSDILFFESTGYRELETYPSWVYTSSFENSKANINNYFIENANNVLGLNKLITNQFGKDEVTVVDNGKIYEIDEIIGGFTSNIYNTIEANIPIEKVNHMPLFEWIKENELYIYSNGKKEYSYSSDTKQYQLIDKLINMYDLGKDILNSQLTGISDTELESLQNNLLILAKSVTGNKPLNTILKVLRNDERVSFLNTFENIERDSNNNIISVEFGDIFYKRTLNNYIIPKDISISDGLLLSLNEKNKVDLEYISQITGIDQKKLEVELIDKEEIVFCPIENKHFTTNEYLSGNVREKLNDINKYIEYQSSLGENTEVFKQQVEKLMEVIPTKLYLEDITTNLGSTWIPIKIYNEWIENLFNMSYFYKNKGHGEVSYNSYRSSYNVDKKLPQTYNTLNNQSFGTKRISALAIIEDSLNLKKCLIKDPIPGSEPRQYIINNEETLKALEKQELLSEKFREFCINEKKEELEEIYNLKFNSVVNRKYDGSYLKFNEMNSTINLRDHQKNAVARILQSGNTLLAHSVGAGKTFEIIASAMESKRLGISTKSLVVVPNHLISQWENEWLELYPNANILSSTKKDFTKENRNIFLNRISSNDYDGIIIGHSQFQKLGLSLEYQRKIIDEEMLIIDNALYDGHISVKACENKRKQLETRLNKLIDEDRKDTSIKFEETGIDRLYVDEAHLYKNLGIQTKMANVSGLNNSTGSIIAFDMYMKTKYINEKTKNKGVVFATGTPISNSMSELYTMQRYLQSDRLEELDLHNFDSWASTFGETTQSFELSADGSGNYQVRTRFSKFNNIPELITTFKEVADVITSDMLDLPVPPHELHVDVSSISTSQKEEVLKLSKRAELIKSGSVDPTQDNMLKITNDGRKIALDMRLIGIDEDFKGSKLNKVANNATNIYNDTVIDKSTQLIFCDLSTPNKTKFNVYDELKRKLILNGISENEIAFIHDYDTEKEKEQLFDCVNKGQIRILLGSTAKMGSGTNVQKLLIAVHHVDCPWRPSDIEQRNGRILRQGNTNKNVHIYNYITEETFDAYLYQIVENKQKFISQIMTSKIPSRTASDVDEASLSYGEIKALASGNPLIKEKMEVEVQLNKLYSLERSYDNELQSNRNRINSILPKEIEMAYNNILKIQRDIDSLKDFEDINNYIIDNVNYNKKEVVDILQEKLLSLTNTVNTITIAKVNNFTIKLLSYDGKENTFNCVIGNNYNYSLKLGLSETGNITRIENTLKNISNGKVLETQNQLINNKENELVELKHLIEKGFSKKVELEDTKEKLNEIEKLLNSTNIIEKDQDHEDVLEVER